MPHPLFPLRGKAGMGGRTGRTNIIIRAFAGEDSATPLPHPPPQGGRDYCGAFDAASPLPLLWGKAGMGGGTGRTNIIVAHSQEDSATPSLALPHKGEGLLRGLRCRVPFPPCGGRPVGGSPGRTI